MKKQSGKAALNLNKTGVFVGPNAIRDFLQPENSPPIPLVELPECLNPFYGQRVRIFAKLMYLLPLLNVKSLPALNMLLEAQDKDELAGVETIIEHSSGNTAFSLGILAKLFGINHVIAIVPWDIAPGKLEMLRLSGVEPKLSRSSSMATSGISLAREEGKQPGWFNPAQYENDANPSTYEKWVAPEIWRQTDKKLTVFASGLGTSGTLIGAARYYRRVSSRLALVGSICAPQNAVPGVRSADRLREISFPWNETADYIIEVGTKESFKKSLELCRNGLIAGPSSGFTLAGLVKFFQECNTSKLDSFRNEDDEVIAAFICADTPLPYLDKYSTHLDHSDY